MGNKLEFYFRHLSNWITKGNLVNRVNLSSLGIRALYNQINHLQTEHLKKNTMDDFKFIGTIRDLANNAVSSVLGNVYYVETDDISYEPNRVYEYKWYSVQELIDRYNKATSWSRTLIDMMVDKSIYKYL